MRASVFTGALGRRISRRVRSAAVLILVLASCGGSPPEEARREPTTTEPLALDELPFPPYPEMSEDVSACAHDYRDLAATPFPRRRDDQPFSSWYAGSFDEYVQRYNAVRERCDGVFQTVPIASPEAQVLLATQSYLHVHMANEAAPHEQEPEMFVMSRYWTLGAACTYQHCAEGPPGAWASLCARQARMLPDCPPVPTEEERAAESEAEGDAPSEPPVESTPTP